MGKRDTLTLKKILSRRDFNPNEVFCKDCETSSPVFMAVANGWMSGLRLLVQAGADINQQLEIVECRHSKTRHLMTPLMFATNNHHFELVHAIVDQGGDVTVCDPNTNISPLFIAASTNQPYTLAFFLSTIDKKYAVKPENTPKSTEDFNGWDIPDRMINLATTSSHQTLLAAALGNMGFRYDSIYPSEPFTLVHCDKIRQEKALNVIEILLNAGAEMLACDVFSLPLPFLCATVRDTRALLLFIRHGLDVNLEATPEFSMKCPASLMSLPLPSKFSLVTFYLSAKYFKAALMLVNAGCTLSNEDKRHIVAFGKELEETNGASRMHNEENVKSLMKLLLYVTQVPSMLWLCKKTVRTHIQPCIKRNISKLPLPKVLTKYIADVYEDI